MSEQDAADFTVVEVDDTEVGADGEVVEETVTGILDADGNLVAVDDLITVEEPDGSVAFDETVSVVDDDGNLVTVDETIGAMDAEGNVVVGEISAE